MGLNIKEWCGRTCVGGTKGQPDVTSAQDLRHTRVGGGLGTYNFGLRLPRRAPAWPLPLRPGNNQPVALSRRALGLGLARALGFLSANHNTAKL